MPLVVLKFKSGFQFSIYLLVAATAKLAALFPGRILFSRTIFEIGTRLALHACSAGTLQCTAVNTIDQIEIKLLQFCNLWHVHDQCGQFRVFAIVSISVRGQFSSSEHRHAGTLRGAEARSRAQGTA